MLGISASSVALDYNEPLHICQFQH